jgi:hypothetical protein
MTITLKYGSYGFPEILQMIKTSAALIWLTVPATTLALLIILKYGMEYEDFRKVAVGLLYGSTLAKKSILPELNHNFL